MYDHIYWMLCFGETRHYTPVGLLPEMARYTLFVDGISKAFAATGLRVGWGVGPVDVIDAHVGRARPHRRLGAARRAGRDGGAAGRPRRHPASTRRTSSSGLQARLDKLHQGLQAMKGRGLPVESIPPMGAIYLTARIHPFGRRTSSGTELRTNSEVRKYVLEAAGIGIVPFQAFGSTEDDGWFRLSVGAVSLEEIDAALPRLEEALGRLS